MFLLLLAGVACAPRGELDQGFEPLPAPPGLQSVDDWEKQFLSHWDVEHAESFLPASTSRDSWQFYSLAYGIDGNTAMYRATGKVQYLDRALLYVDNMVRTARDSWSLKGGQFEDVYRGWASGHPESLGLEVPLYESYCWRYVTRLLRVIRETPALYGNARYRGQYQRLLEFSEMDIFEKWFQRGADAHIYRENTHMASHWASIAMDLALMTSDEARKVRYREVFDKINRGLPNHPSSLRDQLGASTLDAAASFWSDEWGVHSGPGQDVSHGNGVVAYIVEAHGAGMEWTDEDVRALLVTLDSVIWPSAGQYAQFVDGSGTGDGWFNDGFMKLGRYDAALQLRLETHLVGWNTQYFGNAALNVRLLSEQLAR
ncbi:hypothetical protein D187_009236 [Cystobacter fuscus DSM 2262]|uniref:Uncharacterized protein n=1 Tax=Cystobacter fuscus (strain ATCC 25194 / DSM 2262 / NBRC 100088 / M29) TaxID=1242864 RepID=S9NU10_CYSF2|nr:hypothetical protein [Cystobacter fuscus]EPX55625.1 hypothetical protein D187_009236 [Cystobacter fuscus DSM 2262]